MHSGFFLSSKTDSWLFCISFGFCSLQVLSTQFSKSDCLIEPVVPWHNVTLIDIRRIRSYSTVCLVLNGCKRSPHFLSTDDVQSNSNAVENTKNWVQNCKAKLIMDSPGQVVNNCTVWLGVLLSCKNIASVQGETLNHETLNGWREKDSSYESVVTVLLCRCWQWGSEIEYFIQFLAPLLLNLFFLL